MIDTPKTLIHSFKNFLTGTLLSRFSGLFREIIMAATFGVNPTIASFWMAFRFANLFRRLFGEGGLNMAFIPHYETLKKKNSSESSSFFIHLSKRLIIILLPLIMGLEFILGSFLIWGDFSPDTYQTLSLTMIFLPSLLFLSLFALNCALLNSERSYFLPSAAPSVVNLLWITAALILPYITPERSIEYLAMCIVFAFAFQWLVTAIPCHMIVSQYPLQKKEPLLPFLKPFLLTIMGVTAQQINGAIDALFAKSADPAGPAFLWYALRLQQLPFALIGVGLMNSLLPPLSRAPEETFQKLLNYSLKKIITFMIPLTGAILVGSIASVNLLYGRGAFSEQATYETSFCLMAYGLSLLPMSWTLLLASAFYAQKNYKIPTFCSLGSIGCNVLLNALFVYIFHWKSISIALSTSLSSILNGIVLTLFLFKTHKEFLKGAGNKMLKISALSLVALVITFIGSNYIASDNTMRFFLDLPFFPLSRSFTQQIFSLGVISFFYGGILMLLGYLFNIEEIKILQKHIKT